MSKYASGYTEKKSHQKHKSPKFRDYYDEEFTEEDEKEVHSRRKKLWGDARITRVEEDAANRMVFAKQN